MADMIEATGLWKGKTKDGDEYFSGNMGKVRVLIFANKHKKESKHPDYNMYFTENKRKEDITNGNPDRETKTMDEIETEFAFAGDNGDNDPPF